MARALRDSAIWSCRALNKISIEKKASKHLTNAPSLQVFSFVWFRQDGARNTSNTRLVLVVFDDGFQFLVSFCMILRVYPGLKLRELFIKKLHSAVGNCAKSLCVLLSAQDLQKLSASRMIHKKEKYNEGLLTKAHTILNLCLTAQTNFLRNLTLVRNCLMKCTHLLLLRMSHLLTYFRRLLTNTANADRFFLERP